MDKSEDTPEMLQRQSESAYREGFQPNEPYFKDLKNLFKGSSQCTFADFMGAALYGENGYYRHLERKPGRSGDFYTSVSVGPIFGEIIASDIEFVLEQSRNQVFWLVEQGGHDGQLMLDVCRALKKSLFTRRLSHLWEKIRVAMVEPFPEKQEIQRKRFKEGELCEKLETQHVTWLSSERDLPSSEGVYWANELLDAFPPHVAILNENREWRELWVKSGVQGNLEWVRGAWSGKGWEKELPRWEQGARDGNLEPGHRIEWCPQLERWAQNVVDSGWKGAVLLFDYGIGREDRFEKGRRHGTLRRYRQHQMDDRVLEEPGQCDLTWQVDWPMVREVFQTQGWRELGFLDQSRYLVQAGMKLLKSREGKSDPQWSRQFQTLTHPGMMGGSFQVLGVAAPTFESVFPGFNSGSFF